MPEERQALDQQVQAIAKSLSANADKTRTANLEDIKKQVREQLLAPVSPQLGSF